MTLQTDSGNVTVVLNGDTQVEDVAGVFHARKKQMGVAALVPGLAVKVKGNYNSQNQLVADTVQFNGKSLQTATDIQAGVAPVEQQEQAEQKQMAQQEAQIQKVAIDPQYKPRLLALCQKAKTVNGYVIQVKGYASAVGSAALNQKLSQERAQNVIDFLEQQGGIPLTNVLAPGAMGTSKQVASDATAEGQAENRRVVVRVLQNKGIAGT
jgi:outer membrane protein OmpA-like peptidoglycan-associated protein